MNHREADTTFNRFYSRGTGNIDITAIRNLEINSTTSEAMQVRVPVLIDVWDDC